jgi:hypothetical protein
MLGREPKLIRKDAKNLSVRKNMGLSNSELDRYLGLRRGVVEFPVWNCAFRNVSDLMQLSLCFCFPLCFPFLCFTISTLKFSLYLLSLLTQLSLSNSTLLFHLISETPVVFNFRLCHLVLIAFFFCVNRQFATILLCFVLATILT